MTEIVAVNETEIFGKIRSVKNSHFWMAEVVIQWDAKNDDIFFGKWLYLWILGIGEAVFELYK